MPTQVTIAAFFLLAFALVAGVAATLHKINTDLMPEVRDFRKALAEMNTKTALTQQQVDENTARLGRQGARIDIVLAATPPPVALVAAAPAPDPAPAAIPPELAAAIQQAVVGTDGDMPAPLPRASAPPAGSPDPAPTVTPFSQE